MQLPPVYIATHNAEEYLQLIHDHLEVVPEISHAGTKEDAVSLYDGQPVVLARPDFAAALMQTKPPVQWLQSTWAGVTPLIEIDYRNYQLTGLKDIFGPQMADYVMGYVLAHELRIEQRSENQKQRAWDDQFSGELRGKVMGILGTGSIGAHVAQVAKQFGIEVLGLNTSGREVEPFSKVFSITDLFELLAQCDYLVSILPNVPGTNNLLNSAAFTVMKKTALLINVGRGNVIVESELCEALNEGEVAGAVLDVFQEEPLPQDSILWDASNLKITGHVAAVSRPNDIVRVFAENYRRFTLGESLFHIVDFEKGY